MMNNIIRGVSAFALLESSLALSLEMPTTAGSDNLVAVAPPRDESKSLSLERRDSSGSEVEEKNSKFIFYKY